MPKKTKSKKSKVDWREKLSVHILKCGPEDATTKEFNEALNFVDEIYEEHEPNIIKDAPDDHQRLQLIRAGLFYLDKQYDNALKLFRKGTEHFPKVSGLHSVIAHILVDKHGMDIDAYPEIAERIETAYKLQYPNGVKTDSPYTKNLKQYTSGALCAIFSQEAMDHFILLMHQRKYQQYIDELPDKLIENIEDSVPVACFYNFDDHADISALFCNASRVPIAFNQIDNFTALTGECLRRLKRYKEAFTFFYRSLVLFINFEKYRDLRKMDDKTTEKVLQKLQEGANAVNKKTQFYKIVQKLMDCYMLIDKPDNINDITL